MNSAKYPSIAQAAILGLIFIVLSLIIAGSVFFIFGAPEAGDTSIFHELLNIISYVAPLGLVIILGISCKAKWNEEKDPLHFRSVSPKIYIAAIVPVLAIVMLTEPIVNLIPMPDWIAEAFQNVIKKSFLSMLLITIFAPLLEELLFRGIILDGFLQRYTPQKAIIISSLFFGIFHLNPWQFIPAFFGGLFMGWIYYRTRSLWPCIFIHFIVNFSSFLAFLAVDDAMVTIYDLVGNKMIYIALLIVFTLVGIFFTKYISSDLPKIDWEIKPAVSKDEIETVQPQ